MLRWVVLLCLVAWAGIAQAQISHYDFETVDQVISYTFGDRASRPERLPIEVVPMLVFSIEEWNASIETRMVTIRTRVDEIPEVMSTTHRALGILGVTPLEYDLTLSNHVEVLVCIEPSTMQNQQCYHENLSWIESVTTMVRDLYPDTHPEQGTVQLHVLSLPEKFAWLSTEAWGAAFRWQWTDDPADRTWRNSACRAWSIHVLSTVAHELGHCFGLIHNEDDSDYGIDVMKASSAYLVWLKDSNRELVQRHFSESALPNPTLSVRPQVELHY